MMVQHEGNSIDRATDDTVSMVYVSYRLCLLDSSERLPLYISVSQSHPVMPVAGANCSFELPHIQ